MEEPRQAFLPEGQLFFKPENQSLIASRKGLEAAALSRTIVEARAVLCDSSHNLHVDLGDIHGFMPYHETALGVSEGSVRDVAILSRVNRPVCFKVCGVCENGGQPTAVLSRRQAQKECRESYILQLKPGEVIPARVTHLEAFGAFVDIGCGLISLIPIDRISVSRIRHAAERFTPGQDVPAVVRAVQPDGRVFLSHRELLGTWQENAALFEAGQTVSGRISSVEEYGIFVELTPNLAGLAEWKPGVFPGQTAGVYIKSIQPEKMKIKLSIVDSRSEDETPPGKLRYFLPGGRLNEWVYSPEGCTKTVRTVFDGQQECGFFVGQSACRSTV